MNDAGSALGRLDAVLVKTTAAYQLLVSRRATESQLAPFRQSLGQLHLKLCEQWLAMGEVEQAISSARQAMTYLPGDGAAVLAVAKAAMAAGRNDAAIAALEAAVGDGVTTAGVRFLLAQLLCGAARPASAIVHFEAAATLAPHDPVVFAALANARAQTGALSAALAGWQKALALSPDNVEYLKRYAVLSNDAGALEEAASAYRRLTQLQPLCGRHHRMLGQQIDYTPGHPHIGQMQAALDASDADGADACELNFGLFRAYEAIGEHARAFAHLKSGNDTLRDEINHRPAVFEQLFAGVETAFSAEAVARLPVWDRADAPIFIVGMPRSGSTLVEQILSSHPDISGVGESNAFAAITEKHFLTPSLTLDLAPLQDKGIVTRLGDDYLATVRQQAGNARRTVDKYLTNFLSIGLIKAMFPSARIVHCHRNPLANCFAIYASYFATSGISFHADMLHTASYYTLYHRLMQHWRDLYGADIFDQSYEGLTQDQDGETRRLLAYCGLSWDPACLDFHKTERSVRTLSYNQVRKPLYSGLDRRTAHYRAEILPMIRILEAAGLA